VEVVAMEHDLCAKSAHRPDLDRIGLLGHEDCRVHAKQPGRVSNRLAMVASGRGANTPAPLVRIELANEIDPAANLERADWLVILVLHLHPGTGQLVERRVLVQGGRPQIRGDARTCSEHVSEVGYGPGRHDLFLARLRKRSW